MIGVVIVCVGMQTGSYVVSLLMCRAVVNFDVEVNVLSISSALLPLLIKLLVLLVARICEVFHSSRYLDMSMDIVIGTPNMIFWYHRTQMYVF